MENSSIRVNKILKLINNVVLKPNKILKKINILKNGNEKIIKSINEIDNVRTLLKSTIKRVKIELKNSTNKKKHLQCESWENKCKLKQQEKVRLKSNLRSNNTKIEKQLGLLNDELHNYDFDIDLNFDITNSDVYSYKNMNEKTKFQCKRIYNDIENSFYTEYDLFITYAYYAMFNEKISYDVFTYKNVLQTQRTFTMRQLKLDRIFINNIVDKMKIDVWDLFELNSSEENKIYNLIKTKFVSVCIFMEIYCKIHKKYLTETKKSVKLYNKDSYLFFKRLNILIYKLLRIKNRRQVCH